MARKLTFTPGTAAGTAVVPLVLGDDSVGDHIAAALPVWSNAVQTVQPLRSRPVYYNRAGVAEEFTWRVDRNHGSEDAAVNFQRAHGAALAAVVAAGAADGTLLDAGSTSRVFRNCTLTAARCVAWDGQSTVYEYTAVGGPWSESLNL